jgi:putative membrane protein
MPHGFGQCLKKRLAASSRETFTALTLPMPDDKDDPRVLYAADRTVLAAERTYAAWVRTGLVALVAGVGAKTSLGSVLPEWAILFNATLLVLFSGFCFAVAVWRELRPGHDSPRRSDVWRLPRMLLVVVNGGLLLVSLGALLGVWFGRTGGT